MVSHVGLAIFRSVCVSEIRVHFRDPRAPITFNDLVPKASLQSVRINKLQHIRPFLSKVWILKLLWGDRVTITFVKSQTLEHNPNE
jgi:hypothetical protein